MNGVPLKRVNQVYTITTSTVVSTAGVKIDNIDDKLFARESRKKGYKSARKFFAEEKPKSGVSEVRKSAQVTVDGALSKNIKPEMKKYLHARFSLVASDKPHAMKF